MLPIPTSPRPRCDCCGEIMRSQSSDYCSRCGYPVNDVKEELFLEESIRNLQRVAMYGGAQVSVASLLQRYRARLSVVRQYRRYAASVPQAEIIVPQSISRAVPVTIGKSNTRDQPMASTTFPENTSFIPPTQSAHIPFASATSVPQQMFSLRSFFAQQTINIVSALGAFLILIGSLSFVVTTTNLFLSFLVLFIVHLIFATVGFVFTRFQSFRFIARIYTAIFALLVPLVGFAGYRLVAGHLIQVSAPTVVAIAATYAAIVYAVLAVSQQYKPFGYLSVVALVLADLAIAYALHLNYWWWPVLLMPLTFVGLLAIGSDVQRLFGGSRAVLREPVRVLMFTCVTVLCLDILCTYLYAIEVDIIGQPFSDIRIAGAVMLLSIVCWTSMYLWMTKNFMWLAIVAYQFLGFIVALAYVLNLHAVAYGLLFTAVAAFYHVSTLVVRHPLQRFQHLRNHMDGIALVLVALVPLLVAPLMPLNLFRFAYMEGEVLFFLNGNTLLAMIGLVISGAVTVSIVLNRTGLQRIPMLVNTGWRWVLLLSGFLFTWAYSIVVLSLHIMPVYAFLALTLLLLVGTMLVRRFVSAAWSNPLDVLVLSVGVLTLLLNFGQGEDNNIALLLLFAVLAYGMVFYQRRYSLLFMPVLFMALAFPFLLGRPRIMLLLGVVLPLLGLLVVKSEQHRRRLAAEVSSRLTVKLTGLFSWEWPLLLTGLFYAIVVCGMDILAPTSTVQNLLGIPFSVALELAGLAMLWYSIAALARQQRMLIITIGFVVASLFIRSNPLWVIACLAAVTALLALGMGRVIAKVWVAPLYVSAILAAVVMGTDGYTGGHAQLALVAWLLLGFALLIYGIGVIEDFMPFLWLASFFAVWSVYDSGLLGDLYRAPFVVLICAALGVSIGCLGFMSTFFTLKRGTLLRFALPFYVTAIAAAVLTGTYGMLGNINYPFPSAIPDALLLYAAVAFGVLVFERQQRWLWLVAVFAAWGILLVARLDGEPIGSTHVSFTTYYLTGVALATGVIGIVVGRLNIGRDGGQVTGSSVFSWNWPWYCVSLLAIVVTVIWNTFVGGVQIAGTIVYGSLFAFIMLAFVVVLVERRQAVLVLPIALGLWGIAQTQWALWQQMGALSVLFFVVSVMYYGWSFFSSNIQRDGQGKWYTLLGLGGQVLVVLTIIGEGGLATDIGMLARVGVGALLLLAVQLFCYGWMQQKKQRWTMYGAGLLVALAISWELSVLHQMRIEWLTLAPATYLIVVAPFLSRDERIVQHKPMGQLCSIFGAALLLLPTLWSSFSEASILPTFILAGEALALLLLGVATRVRFFVLSGAGLVVVCAMHALFLPSLGIPPSLALTIMGGTLLGLATALSLARHRLQAVWTHLD